MLIKYSIKHQLNDLEQFWALLDRYEQDGRLPDMTRIPQRVQ